MLVDDEQIRGLRLPNTLELPPSHTAAMIGLFLKSLYAETLSEAHPRHLTALNERLDEAERRSMKAGPG